MTIWTPELEERRPRYLAIVEALVRDVESGRLADGAQLPTQRELARRLDLSLGTVTRAYALAEERGLVRGEVGRGTFVGPAAGSHYPFSETGQVQSGAINLGMTWPLESENPDLAPVLRKLARRADLAELLSYQPNAGMNRHRRVGAEWIGTHGLDVDPGRVLVCAGAQHAMTIVFATLARSGDTVLCEEATYPGARSLFELFGLKAVGLAMDSEGILPEAFEAACVRRTPKLLYVVPSISNPTTATMSTARRRAIAEVAREHGVPIVEDAIHHRLLDPEDAPPLLSSFAPERSYLVASPSKVVAGGLRVAFLAAPPAVVDELSHRLWATNWMVSPLTAEVFREWMADGTAEATVERKREESRVRNDMLTTMLHGVGAGLSTAPTGYHAWIRLPEEWPDANAFAAECQRRGVSVTAAGAFHVGTGAPPPAVRVSLSVPASRDTLREGLRRLAMVLDAEPSLRAPVV